MMVPKTASRVSVRAAVQADIPALTDIKGSGSEAIHRDRLRDAQDAGFRYLVLLAERELIGFACLVSRRPSYWSDADDMQHLPQIIDVQVKESHRGQGYGSDFIHALEQEPPLLRRPVVPVGAKACAGTRRGREAQRRHRRA